MHHLKHIWTIVMLKICKHTFYAYLSRIWKMMQFCDKNLAIRKVFIFFWLCTEARSSQKKEQDGKGKEKIKKTERTSKEKKETWHRCLVSISPDLLCSHCPSTCHQNTQQEQNKKNITLSIYLKMEPRTYQNKTDNTR